MLLHCTIHQGRVLPLYQDSESLYCALESPKENIKDTDTTTYFIDLRPKDLVEMNVMCMEFVSSSKTPGKFYCLKKCSVQVFEKDKLVVPEVIGWISNEIFNVKNPENFTVQKIDPATGKVKI